MDRTHLNLASVTKYVKINASEAVTVEVHVASRGYSYKWFKDQHMQEALIVAYKVLQMYYSYKKDLSKFYRSGDLRILSQVKPVTTSAIQHLLVLDERIYDIPSALPNYGLINVNGNKVFSYLHEHTTACQYTPYKVLSLVVSLYLDSLELSSNDGVVKINRTLHPSQPIVSDIVSLFKSLLDTSTTDLDEIPESHQPSLPLTVSSKRAKLGCSRGPLPLKLKTSQASNSRQTTLTTFRKGHGKQTSSLNTLQDINTEPIQLSSFIYDSPPTKHHLHTLSPPTCPLLSTSPLDDDCNNSQDSFDSIQKSVADTSSYSNESSSSNWISCKKRPNLSSENNLSNEEPSAKRLSHDENDLEMVEEDKVGNKTGCDLLALMEKMSDRAKELEEKRNEYIKFDEEIQQIKAKYEAVPEVINISSGDEDEVNENDNPQLSWKKTYRASPKRKEVFKQLFSEYNGINELTELTLKKWIKIRQETLVQIFTGKLPSERCEMFHKGKRERASLQYQVNTVMFTREQLKFFTDTLHGVFCPRSDKNFNYLWLVLIPEAVVHLIMDYHQLNYNEAEYKMYHYHPIKIETIDL